MEENTEALVQEDTTPSATAEDTEQSVDTHATVDTDTAGEDTTPPDGEEEAEAQPTEQPFVVHYNHKPVELSQSDAQKYCQQWMHINRDGGLMDKITELADRVGDDAETMINRLIENANENEMQSCLEEAGGNEDYARMLYDRKMDGYKTAHLEAKERRAKSETDDVNAVTQRLADEFTDMQDKFPELTGFEKIPQNVIDTAIGENIHLMDAYLRHKWQESTRRKTNDKQQKYAEAATAGSMSDAVTASADDPIIRQIKAAVRSVL